ncbi:MAG: DNA replication/repair protein RecF [Bacillota bacterium]|nr:DNA replication/repair protein RecF [Bacillota bacterium]
MLIKNIELKNFRNYKNLKLEFDDKLNIFLGQNAQGKTNLLESLFVIGMGKSFRTNSDKEMILFNQEFANVKANILDDNNEDEIEITYRPEGKIIKLDGIKLKRTVDLLETVYIVEFSPEDLKIVKEGPDHRRRFLDRELCQIKPIYYSDLGNYKKVLKERNSLLRQKNLDKNLYSVFNEALSEYGVRIKKEREIFINRILDISKNIHKDITSGMEELNLSYETKITDKESYIKTLEENFNKDIEKGFTSFGPHKDDIKIEINGIDIRTYGSQGQQRTAALSMKLAEIGLIKQETGKDAVLMLDDVLSELDQNRQRYLIEAMKGIQIFITATEIDENLRVLLPEGKTFKVDNGTVKNI